MEKLILRSVLYGADKIPDSWFDKIPGGFFREKDSQNKTNQKSGSSNSSSGARSSRRHSVSDSRRHRNDYRHRDDGYRSETEKRRPHRGRSSYDGGADDDDGYHSEEHRRKSNEGRHSKRRSYDPEPSSYQSRRDGRPSTRDRETNERSRHMQAQGDERPSSGGNVPPPNPFSPNAYVPTVAPIDTSVRYDQSSRDGNASSPAFLSPQGPSPQQIQPDGIMKAPYVPYAHIYGRELQTNPPYSPAARPQSSGSDAHGRFGGPSPPSPGMPMDSEQDRHDRRSGSERRGKVAPGQGQARFVDARKPLDVQMPDSPRGRPNDGWRGPDEYNDRGSQRRHDRGYHSD